MVRECDHFSGGVCCHPDVDAGEVSEEFCSKCSFGKKFPGCTFCKHSVPSEESPRYPIPRYYKMYCTLSNTFMNDASEHAPANVTACEKFEDANEVEIVRIINKGW